MVLRRDQLASKASKKEDGRGRGRGRAPGRGRGRGKRKGGRGKRGVEAEHSSGESENEMEEDECEMGEENGESVALEETKKKRKKNQHSDAKTPKPKAPKVPKVPKNSCTSTPRSDAEPKNPKTSSTPKAQPKPKPARASSSKPAASKPSRASSSKAEPRSKTKDPKTSIPASKSKSRSKKARGAESVEGDESRPSKRRVSKGKNRAVADNDASAANASGDFEQKVGEICDFTEGLDYHNLEFDDLKFYTKEALMEYFEFTTTQLNIYWKTCRCGIKICDPYSFQFAPSLGTPLLRMVVAVATGAYMVARS